MPSNSKRIIAAAIVVACIVVLVWYVTRQPIPFLGRGLPGLRSMVPSGAGALYDSAMDSYDQYRDNAGRWSAVYFGCTFGAAVLSAGAGVILKLEILNKHPALQKDLAAVLAACAALLITLSTTGNFESKWRANRLAASEMEGVIYKLAQPTVDRARILEEIAAIHRRLNQSVAAGQVVSREVTDTVRVDAVQPKQPDANTSNAAASTDTTKKLPT